MRGSEIGNGVVGAERARLLRLATAASVGTAALLVSVKLVAWWLSGSVSVLASLVDSLMDAVASGLNLIAVRIALRPADAGHRFGHGKAEPLAGLAQAAFIAGSALFLVLHAAERLANPEPLERVGIALGVMGLAMTATLVLLVIQRHVIRRTGSPAIRADSLHYLSDLLANLGTVLALLLAAAGWASADALIALAIAAYVLRSAWRIGAEAVQALMDHELPRDQRRRILALASAHPQVRSVHDLRTRYAGGTVFIQLHLVLDDALPLVQAHGVAVVVAGELRRAFPGADVIIHQDPVSAGVEPAGTATP